MSNLSWAFEAIVSLVVAAAPAAVAPVVVADSNHTFAAVRLACPAGPFRAYPEVACHTASCMDCSSPSAEV